MGRTCLPRQFPTSCQATVVPCLVPDLLCSMCRMVLYILYIAIGAFVGGLVGVGGLMWNGAQHSRLGHAR